jgi:hypothetical protein
MPHKDSDLLDVALKIRDQGYHPPIPAATPTWLAELCERCWTVDPTERPTMKDIVNVFSHHVPAAASTRKEKDREDLEESAE